MVSQTRISVIVPTTDMNRLRFLLKSLASQTLAPWEVIVVAKGVEIKVVESRCETYRLNCVVLEQKEGYFTKALNMGKSVATGDIVVFTDDDAIALENWMKKYAKLFRLHDKNIGCISSNDIYIDLPNLRLLPTTDDDPIVRFYRTLGRPILEKPISPLRKYWCGVYIDRKFAVKHGPCIPGRESYSLPFRGVNMAFRREAIEDAAFPEHPLLKRAPGNEQYVGLQLVLKGWDGIYTPKNPILHMYRKESLSRTKKEELLKEKRIIERMYGELLNVKT
ncbi:MAG: glycosyltransferase [Thermofilaceae archaeon]|uniref:glycosyltransferase family 2 protein n=1 Tax=Pyrobaculum sp. TaxID=2004705 RepID=UPI003171073C